jgi:hypothetical protein
LGRALTDPNERGDPQLGDAAENPASPVCLLLHLLLEALLQVLWLASQGSSARRVCRCNVRRYIRDAELFDDNAAAGIGL